MPPGRVIRKNAVIRDHIECAQVLLMSIAVDIDEVAIRIDQAIKRTHIVRDVLQPSQDRLEGIRSDLATIQDELSQTWRDGQANKWNE